MTLTQLRYLLAIVDQGFNISRAAAALHTSQPGISRQVRLLEQQLGINILVRNAGRVTGLTEQGAQVAEAGRSILKVVDSLRQMGDEALQREAGELRIATLHSLALSLLPRALVGVRQAYPGVSVDVQQASAGRTFELVRAGQVEFGVTIERPPLDYGLAALHVADMPRVLLVPDGHPLLRQPRPALQDLAAQTLIFSNALLGVWDVPKVFQTHGIELQPMVRVMDASVIKAFVRAGAGVAILSSSGFDPAEDHGLKAIDLGHLFAPSPITIVFDPFKYMRGYGYLFIELLAPAWTRSRVDQEIRGLVYAADT